jgi:CheY-like chemotaxis protein
VFDLFIQGERSSDRTQGGLGLGLALVKSLAERHGGQVMARSAGLGRGSEFDVVLPRAAGSARGAPGPGSTDESSPHSILIVDDNADAARTLALYLQAHGHQVQVAFDGAQALGLARNSAPRVLLLDIGLPDMDGYALARHLREMPSTRDCVYIALTGYGCPEDRERSRKAGFDHHLTKPVNALELAALIGALEPAHH